MKKSDIRKGTNIIILFVVVCVIVMLAMMRRDTSEQMLASGEDDYIIWSDTLSNASSEYAPLSGMDSEIERFLAKWNMAGLSLAVTRHDSLLYAKGYGWANRELNEPMTPGSVMRIASASKLVTAAAIMKLQEEGKLSLDSKVFGPDGILSDSIFTNRIKDNRIFDITVDHLLQHKGGFTLGAGDPMMNTADIIEIKKLDTVPDNEELMEIVLGRRIGFTPGAGRRYSNFGYMLLSQIVEKVSGKSYWHYTKEDLLTPIGALKFRPATNYYEERYQDEVKYYGPDDEKVKEYNGSGRMVDLVYGGRNVKGLEGAGGWVTSAPDFARFVAAIDNDPGVPDVLTRNSIDLMTEAEDDENRARGWSDADEHGKWVRTGTLGSTHSYIAHFPDGETWVMISNSGIWTGFHFSHDMARLVNALRQRYGADLPRRNLW